MKILQICSKPPLPSLDGGCKATHNFTQGLLDADIEVKVITISTQKHPFVFKKLPKDYVERTNVEAVNIDTSIKLSTAFFHLFNSTSYNISRFHSAEFNQLIIRTLKESSYDVVLFEGLFICSYVDTVRSMSEAKLVYRAHNVEYEIWERNAEFEKNIFKKKYLSLLAKQLKHFELAIINHFDFVASITEKDKQVLLNHKISVPIQVFPFGIDLNQYVVPELLTNATFFHIGSMDWIPNQMGIQWFLNEVWSEFVSQNNETKFVLAGKKMPEWMKNLKQTGVQIVGEVDDALEFINDNAIMIVPLFSGSGMRVKIIEAMALSKVVIATSVALEGIDYEHKNNVLVADTKEEFLSALSDSLNAEKTSTNIGRNARKLVENKYCNKQIVGNLIEFINS